MENTARMTTLVLKAVALAMAVVVIVMGVLGTLEMQTAVTLLAIGLAALALNALQDDRV